MGSDDDAMHRRDDAHEWGWFVDDSGLMVKPGSQFHIEFALDNVPKEALDILWGRVAELPAGVEGEMAEGEGEEDGPGEVDKNDGMGHDAAMTTTGELAGGPATGVLPLPMIDYIRWNHMAWDSEEVQPFDVEPGFWQTMSEVGVPSSWYDIKVDYSGDTEVISSRAEELAEEAVRRGIPVIEMLSPEALEGAVQMADETQPMPVAAKPRPPSAKKYAQKRAQARQRTTGKGSDQD